MNCIFKVNCRSCDCSFQLSSKDFSDREKLSCPNCYQNFPKEDFEALKSAILSLQRLKENIGIPKDSVVDKHKGFYLSMELSGELPF